MTQRDQISLDGVWQFSHEGGAWREAVVPGPWQAQFADLRHASGRAVYRREFARFDLTGQMAVLCFGAVSYLAEVWLNGHLLGSHEGGYLPFEFVLTDEMLQDNNQIEVRVSVPGDADTVPAFAEIPHGKQSWYGPIGGIWQQVRLELRAPVHLRHCAISAQVSGSVAVVLEVSGQAAAGLEVLDEAGRVVAEGRLVAGETEAQLLVTNPALWSPDQPNLYHLRVSLACDTTLHRFGFRSFETRAGQFFLNGQPYYMRAALDQDYYPEGICTPPSLGFLEDQLRKAKALGLNMLRCHIKVPDPRYYEVADRLGMLIWTEIPNVGQFTAGSARRMRETMEGILQRDGNAPCIVIWTLINEDWGTRLCEDPAHRAWLAAEYDWLKQRDPSRLVVDNSPCHGNFHVKTDINDFHYYRSVPERRREWDALTAEFAAGADWTYTPFSDGQRSGSEPLVVSEFGVWGLPDPAQVQLGGAEPWWMETGGAWGEGTAYPHGVENRFDALRLATVFGDFNRFVQAAQWYQFANLKYQIEVMRSWPQITGYVITEFTDVHWESNGLLDMNRNPRVFHDRFPQINADLVIVPKVTHYAGRVGEAFLFGLALATGGKAVNGAALRWRAEAQSGEISVSGQAHQVVELGQIGLQIAAGANRMLLVEFVLESAGVELARNQIEIAVYNKPTAKGLPKIATTDAAFAAHCAALGCMVVDAESADVTVVRALDAADIARMQAGARYLLVAGEHPDANGKIRLDPPRREQPFIPIIDEVPGLPGSIEGQLPNMVLHARHGSMWRGDWIAGFSWIRRDGVFADMPGGPLVDLSLDRVIPHHVLTGFRAWEYGGPVHAGIVVGWAHKPAALIAERRIGRGGLVATTFRLTNDAPGVDPVAQYLLEALIGLAAQTATDRQRVSHEMSIP
ncbi:glycoside hydrolase family 2 protein [Cypionkella sp. TWP1-2-1b2]|uniref:glycoside hydrolase family 2 protein n=1 Tax=Cypionkella sp. TWP1-2-1b2 TaxID=2804675 RepID=UPI003CE8A7AF